MEGGTSSQKCGLSLSKYSQFYFWMKSERLAVWFRIFSLQWLEHYFYVYMSEKILFGLLLVTVLRKIIGKNYNRQKDFPKYIIKI